MNILVTGGAGYIGSNVVLELINKKHNVVIVDNLTNSSYKRIYQLKELANSSFYFYKIDCADFKKISRVFFKHKFECVIHLAGLKSIQDSIKNPKKYHDANILGIKSVLKAMKIFRVKKIIFSSSASVYGKPKYLPLNETHKTKPMNPYAKSKLQSENIIKNFCKINKFTIGICLRYFNILGSDNSKLLSDNLGNSQSLYSNFLKSISRNVFFYIYGKDFSTKDGTAIRDFVHISDLVKVHMKLLNYKKKKFNIFNIGTGRGYTVLEIINTYYRINNIKPKIFFKKKRVGDIPISYSNVEKIKNEIGWIAKKKISDMCIL
jgi:UDP-glucose 4-epimerase